MSAELVRQATEQSAEKHRITLLADGRIRVPSPLQAIEALVGAEGITVTSTAKDEPGDLTIRATALGRVGGAFLELAPGAVATEAERVRIVRPEVMEELTTSAEGVRQDFVVPMSPAGEGQLVLDLMFDGATLEKTGENVSLALASGRKLLYHRLLVTDSANRQLAASFELLDANRLRIVVADAGASYPVRIDPTITDADWISIALPDTNNTIYAVASDGTSLYAGGAFTSIGGIAANRIAKWNGTAWLPLGTGMDGNVNALVWDGTSLYAGGAFITAGGVTVNRIAKWDGSSWSGVGTGGISGVVSALAWDGANLYAGGSFATAGGVSANNIAKWNGSNWSALGSGTNGVVYALAWSGSTLYAGGSFGTAGGLTANNIARWNGSAWAALGSGTNSAVNALAWAGTNLYAGGSFTTAGGLTANYVAKWNGSVWSALGSGMNSQVRALAWDGSALYAGGEFTTADGATANYIAKWSGSAWSSVGSGVSNFVRALVWDGSSLYAAGDFKVAGGVALSRIARWSGSDWSSVGSGVNGTVYAFACDGINLYAGGAFTKVGDIVANNVARWDGNSWLALGSGLGGPSGQVNALAWDGTNLYAGGLFTLAGGTSANRIAMWNGSSWSALGSGMNNSVSALLWNGTSLYAGGQFTNAGGVAANYIARWDGSTWSAVGSGMGSAVNAFAWDGTNLYAGGFFTTAGGVSANRIAKWNGSAWSALGTGIGATVYALAWDGTSLYAGGQFTTAGGVAANGVAKWSGSAWSALGSGTSSMVRALVSDGTTLYAGGVFTSIGGVSANRIAQWDGSSWSTLGNGLNETPFVLAWNGARLFTGGQFTSAGGASAQIAYVPIKWTVTTSAGGNGNLFPLHAFVEHGSSTVFTVTPDAGYRIDSISGCDGSLSGNSFATGAIAADCTVVATFVPDVSLDDDADGIPNIFDSCPFDPGNDADGDGVCGNIDSCPSLANPTQANFDGDSFGDACDDDDDNDGITDAIEIYNGTDPFNSDTTPPAVTLTSSLTGLTNALSTVLTYGTSEGTVSLTRNGTPVTVASGGTLALVEGRNTIIARSVDSAGNVGTAQVEVNVDTLIFPPTIDALPTVWSQSNFTATGRMEDGATVVVMPPAGAIAGTVTYPTSNSWSCDISGLTSGDQSFSVVSTDSVGNVSAQVSATLTIDLGLPPQVTGLVVTNTYQGGTVTVNWGSYTGPASSYALYVSNTPFTSVTGMTPWRTYTAGTTSATLIGLTDNVAVYVAVVAIGAGGQSIAAVTPVSVIPTRQGVYGTVTAWILNYPLNHIQVQVAGYPPTFTDTLGRYVLTGLPAGAYTLNVGEEGGTNIRFTASSTPITITAGQMLLTNVKLTPKTHNLDCGIPANLTATAGDGKVTLCWDAINAPDLKGYIVYRDGVALQTTTTPWTDTCFTDTGVVNGTTYSYVVTSYSRGNIMSSPTNTVQATPQAATQPPVDLTATLGCDGKVTLNWLRPAGTDQLGYNIYQNAGTTVDYGSAPAYVTGADTTTWTSDALTGGNYSFAVRSVGSAYEETNTHVVVTISVPASWNQPSAAITIPSTGKRVDGNALHVQAEAVAPTCGTVATSSIRFQYRPYGTTNWLDIPAALAQHPNPDTTDPFFTKWDVTGLLEGEYDLRAVASSSTTTDLNPGFITVTVDHHQPEFSQNRAADNSKKAASESEKGRISTTQTGEAQVTFAPNSLTADTTLLVKTPTAEQLPTGSSTLTVAPIDLTLTNGQSTFAAGSEVTVGLTYQDANNDGVIDGTGIFAQDMETVTFNTGTGQWEPLPGVTIDTTKKQIKGLTSHFSMFGAKPKASLSAAMAPPRVYQPTTNTNGSYKLSWDHATHTGRIYELQEASDSNFTQNVTTIYSGSNNYFNVKGKTNGTTYYRVRTAAPGRSPSAWQSTGSPVTVNLTCDNITNIYAPGNNTTGTYTISWDYSRTPNVTYELQVDDGRGFQYLTATTDNYVNLAGIPNGSYAYRVKASKGGFVDSGWKQGATVNVALTVAAPSNIYTTASNTTGSYKVSWDQSRTPGVTYVLTENGATVYTGPNNYFAVKGKTGGAYSYTVQATKSGYAPSAVKGPVLTTVGLACAIPANIYAPASNTTGSYKVSWDQSKTPGVTYVLIENGAMVYTGVNNYYSATGKLNGTYGYTVQTTKSGYAPSAIKGPVATTVTLTVDTPANIYAPASNTTGNYKISWNLSKTPGVTYELYEDGNTTTPLYVGPNNYYNVANKPNGTYSYSVKATKAGHADSQTKGPVSTTVLLTCDAPANIYAPLSNTTGKYQVSWNHSRTPGVTYLLEEQSDGIWSEVATLTVNYVNFTGKANGTYAYRVKATKDGYVESGSKQTATLTVILP